MNENERSIIALSSPEIDAFFPGERRAKLQSLLPSALWLDPAETSAAEWTAAFETCRPRVVVSGWRTPRLPADAPGLEYLCHTAGSVRGLVDSAMLQRGLRVTNWGGIAVPLVAEHALLLILGSLRSLPRWPAFFEGRGSHEDSAKLQTRSLYGRRVALHGFGQIARELIKLLKPFGVVISAYSAGVPADFMREHGARPVEMLEDLPVGADVFVTCEALTEQTRGSINRHVLERVELGSVFVNVGRGAVVDEAALAEVAAVRGLRLGLDVFTREPLPFDSPLRTLADAMLSPHIAGPTHDWYPRCGDAVIDNVERFLSGKPLVNVVTPEMFERST